jgi:hypothetical protein
MDITEYKQINKGCLIAKFNIVIPEWGVTLRDCSFFQKEDQQWISMPSRQYEKDGQKKNFDFVVFEKPMKERLQMAVLEKIKSGFVQKSKEQASEGR